MSITTKILEGSSNVTHGSYFLSIKFVSGESDKFPDSTVKIKSREPERLPKTLIFDNGGTYSRPKSGYRLGLVDNPENQSLRVDSEWDFPVFFSLVG